MIITETYKTKYGMHIRTDADIESKIVGIAREGLEFSGHRVAGKVYEWVEVDSSELNVNTSQEKVYIAYKSNKPDTEPYLDISNYHAVITSMLNDDDPGSFNEPTYNDGFDCPVGTARERQGNKVWCGDWVDVNPIGRYYYLRTDSQGRKRHAYHTGADLNLNMPHWDADRGRPVYAIANGTVTAAEFYPHWGRIVVVTHDPCPDTGIIVSSRYAHLGRLDVATGDKVKRGQKVGIVGQDAHKGPYHLHFDICTSNIITTNPTHWPGENRQAVFDHYTDPKQWILDHRP